MKIDPYAFVPPAYLTRPKCERTFGKDVADLNIAAGITPDVEQQLCLDVLFSRNSEDLSSALEMAVIAARQNMKTGFFKQAALGWLFLFSVRLVVWSAHEFPTSQEAFRDIEQIIESHNFLSRRVKRVSRSHGSEGIELLAPPGKDYNPRLIFKARTLTGSRGLSGDKVILDEAFALKREHMAALMPTLSVRPDPQLVYGSSAGLVASDVLRGVRDRGRVGKSPRLGYVEWCAPRRPCGAGEDCTHAVGSYDCWLDDVALWKAGNPLLGRRRKNGTGLTADYVAAERQALSPADFARERMGQWDEPAGPDAIFTAGAWDRCKVGDRPTDAVKPTALSVAVSYDLTRAAICACVRDDDGGVWVKPLEHNPGIRWVGPKLQELQDRFMVPVAIDGGGPAAALIPDLTADGITLSVLSTGDVLDACADFFDMVSEGKMRHCGWPELDAAIDVTVKRTVGDRWAWGRRVSTGDISVLEAATFSAWLATRRVEAVSVWGFWD